MAKEDFYFFGLLIVWWFTDVVQLLWFTSLPGRGDQTTLLFVIGVAFVRSLVLGLPSVLFISLVYAASRWIRGTVGVIAFVIAICVGGAIALYFWSLSSYAPALPVVLVVLMLRLREGHEQERTRYFVS